MRPNCKLFQVPINGLPNSTPVEDASRESVLLEKSRSVRFIQPKTGFGLITGFFNQRYYTVLNL